MSSRSKEKLREFLLKFPNQIRCQCLRIKNLVLRRRLTLNDLWLSDRIVFEGCPIDVGWDVAGCHRISFSGLNIPGNKTGIRISLPENGRNLSITFHGRGGKVSRSIRIDATRLNLVQAVQPSLILPECTLVEDRRSPSLRFMSPELVSTLNIPLACRFSADRLNHVAFRFEVANEDS
jgi:hypothetical protein